MNVSYQKLIHILNTFLIITVWLVNLHILYKIILFLFVYKITFLLSKIHVVSSMANGRTWYLSLYSTLVASFNGFELWPSLYVEYIIHSIPRKKLGRQKNRVQANNQPNNNTHNMQYIFCDINGLNIQQIWVSVPVINFLDERGVVEQNTNKAGFLTQQIKINDKLRKIWRHNHAYWSLKFSIYSQTLKVICPEHSHQSITWIVLYTT